MRIILLFAFLSSINLVAQSTLQDSLLSILDFELSKKNIYEHNKKKRINDLKKNLYNSKSDPQIRYGFLNEIFEEYKSFKYDSAFNYIKQLQDISYQLNNPEKITEVKIKLGFIFLSSGMFKEAFDSLNTIQPESLPDSIKKDYYTVMALANHGLSDLNDRYYQPIYEAEANKYIDSLLHITDNNSFHHLYYKSLKYIREAEYDRGVTILQSLLLRKTLTLHQIAIVSSTMSKVYINRGDDKKTIELLVMASTYDIKDATKEATAILNLANILFKQGDIKRAYVYTKTALDDANFYGAFQRKIQVGKILPIVEEEKIKTIENQKRALLSYSIVITFLLFVIVIFIIVTLKQLKKIKKVEKELVLNNKELLRTNQRRLEANKIKDEYIGYYFSINSNYIDKIERLKNSIEKNLENNKYDNIRYIVSRINLKKERSELYQRFDRAFLNLFPNFIEEFNALFEDKDQIKLSRNELLNTHLRIFALIRLGIVENDKIAKILEFSVNTIYTYKTKIKNKSKVPNDEFDKHILNIKFA